MADAAPSTGMQVDEQPVPLIFEMPAQEPRTMHLHSSQDLLAVFGLHVAYDKYVRPRIKPVDEPAPPEPTLLAIGPAARKSGTPLAGGDKGKARRVDSPLPAGTRGSGPLSAGPVAIKQEPGLDGQDDDKRKKKKDTSYKHLVRHLPGKHSMKKDSYFVDLLHAAPKQHAPIVPFDGNILYRFAVQTAGVRDHDVTALTGLDDKQKEDKRRRKEEKRAAKERARMIASGQLDPYSPVAGPSTPHPSLGSLVGSGMVINRPSAAVGTPKSSQQVGTPRQQVGTPISRRPSLTPGNGPHTQPPSGVRSRSSTPKPGATGPKQPSVKAETPSGMPTPLRNGQQQAPTQGITRPALNRPGSSTGQQRAAQTRIPGSSTPGGVAGGGSPHVVASGGSTTPRIGVSGGSSTPRIGASGGSTPIPPQQRAIAANGTTVQQPRPRPGSASTGASRPPSQVPVPGVQPRQQQAGTPRPAGMTSAGPMRGTIRKEREPDEAASGRVTPGSMVRPMKKQRVDGVVGPGQAQAQVRRPQPTPQRS